MQIIKTSFNVASFENTDPNFRPVQRSMVNVEIGGKDVELSYDTGSEFSIITKQIFDSLPCKPHLVEVKQSGISIVSSNINEVIRSILKIFFFLQKYFTHTHTHTPHTTHTLIKYNKIKS